MGSDSSAECSRYCSAHGGSWSSNNSTGVGGCRSPNGAAAGRVWIADYGEMSCVLFVGGRGAFDYDYDCERKCKLINACAQVKVPRR